MEIWRSFDFISFDKITFRDFLFQKETSIQQGAIQSQHDGARSALGRDCRRD